MVTPRQRTSRDEEDAPRARRVADAEDARGAEDISGTTAPSIGPNTTFEREDPEERLAATSSPTSTPWASTSAARSSAAATARASGKQATLYGSALAIIAAIVIGFILLAGKLDQPPDTVEDKAPWATEPDAGQSRRTPLQ